MSIPGDGYHVLDEARAEFGIRTLTVDARHRLFINSETVKLRGVCIYANGSFVGQRASGYTPFSVRIDRHLRDGNNEIREEPFYRTDRGMCNSIAGNEHRLISTK